MKLIITFTLSDYLGSFLNYNWFCQWGVLASVFNSFIGHWKECQKLKVIEWKEGEIGGKLHFKKYSIVNITTLPKEGGNF